MEVNKQDKLASLFSPNDELLCWTISLTVDTEFYAYLSPEGYSIQQENQEKEISYILYRSSNK